MINEQQKNMIFPIVFSAVIVLLLGWYILICCDYPYYFIWDMDHVTCLDTVLIQSGLLPNHICHPNSSMYLPLIFSEKIAYSFGIISALNLTEVSSSLNPLAVMAELTDFVRLHSPFLLIGVVIFLCVAIQVIFRLSRWWILFFVFFIGAQESLTYDSSMIRSELYSVFYWCSAVLIMAAAVKTNGLVKRYAGLFVTGILLGLCFLSKVQSLFYLIATPILLLLMFSLSEDSQKKSRQNLIITNKGAFKVLAVSLFNVLAFALLCIFSYQTPIPQGVPTWAVAFRITPIAAMFCLALLSLCFFQLYLLLTNKVSSDVFKFSSFFSVIGAGFILSFALFFLLYSSASLSLQYILINFKIAFLRVPEQALRVPPAEYISHFLLHMRYNPTLFIVHIALISLLVYGRHGGFVQITKYQIALCMVVTCIAFVNVAIVTRVTLRDILWKEVLLNFLNLFYFSILITRADRNQLILSKVGCGLLTILLLVNFAHSHDMPVRIDANYTQYGWRTDRFFGTTYGGNQLKYSRMMRERYNKTTAWIAEIQAAEHKRIRRVVDFVFKNQIITHRNIGIVFEGFSVWGTNLDYKITEVPPTLRTAILVDNALVELKNKNFFKEEDVRKHSEYMDKFKKPSSSELMSVLTRPDLKIFLFVYEKDVSNLVDREIVQTPYKIVLRNAEKAIELQGLEITNYCEIPLDKISRKFFFVIREI